MAARGTRCPCSFGLDSLRSRSSAGSCEAPVSAPRTKLWSIEPHTRAKHEILRRYLEAWTAILGTSNQRVIQYVDGFAGPGAYSGGEEGSPIIALKAALAHQARIPSSTKVRFLFIEENE